MRAALTAGVEMATVAAAMAVATEEALRAAAEWEAVMTEAAVAVATEAAVWAAVAWEVAARVAVAPVAVATEEAVRAAAVWAAVETEEAVWAVAAMAAEELVEVAREVVVWAVVERVAAVAETAAADEAARLAAPVGQRVERAVVRAASSEGPPGYDYCGPSRSRRHPRRSVRTCVLSEVRRDRGVIAARHVRLIMSIRTPADDWSVLVERARVRVAGGDRDI